MRYTEYVLAAVGIALIGVLLARAIPNVQPAPEPPAPIEEPKPRLIERLRPGLQQLVTISADAARLKRLEGQVIAEDGTPIPNAVITATSNRGETEEGASTETGAFAMKPPLPAKVLALRVKAPGYAAIPIEPAHGQVEWSKNGVQGVQLILERESSVSGIVVDEQGNPVSQLPLYLFSSATPDEWEGISLSAKAEFSIRGLNAGDYVFRFRYYGWDPTEDAQGFALQRGESLTELRILAPASLRKNLVSGIVTDPENNAIANAYVYSPGGQYSGDTDEQGRFSILVTKFPAKIAASHAEFSRNAQIIEAATTDMHIVLGPPAYVSGRVLYASNGKPVPKFRVGRQYFESEDGRFTKVRCSAGTTAVGAQANGLPWVYVPMEPPLQHGETREIEFRLPIGRQFEGRVVDGWGRPVRMAIVSVSRANREDSPPTGVGMSDTTNDDGGLLLGPFIDGPVELQVDTRDQKRETFTVDVSPNMPIAVLQLKRRYTVRVEVSGTESYHVEGADVVREAAFSVLVFTGTTVPSPITREVVYSNSPIAQIDVVNQNLAEFKNAFETGTYTAVITAGDFLAGQIGPVMATQMFEIPKETRSTITIQMNLQGTAAVDVQK